MQKVLFRTKVFPYVFFLATCFFSALFWIFYNLIFTTIDDIFLYQTQSLLSGIKPRITNSYKQTDRESKFLYLNRHVQKIFTKHEGQVNSSLLSNSLNRFVFNWKRQLNTDRYRAITYLDAEKKPIVVVDFEEYRNFEEDWIPEDKTISSSIGSTVIEGDLVVNVEEKSGEIIFQSWDRINYPQTGSVVVLLADSTHVLRFIHPITHRQSGEVLGFIGIDSHFNSIFGLEVVDPDYNLIVFDLHTRHLVYVSGAEKGGNDFDLEYPELSDELRNSQVDSTNQSGKYIIGNKQFFFSGIKLPQPNWFLVTSIFLDPYIQKPKTRGVALIIASLFFVVVTGGSIYLLSKRVRRRTAALEQANELVSSHNLRLEEELETAHNMQMGLMPQEQPLVTGYNIIGNCRPATEVGGDFFKYYYPKDKHVLITVADVTGHGMQAAIPTMVFAGLLNTQVQYSKSLFDLMEQLNRSLKDLLDQRTFVCCSVGELDVQTNTIRVSNGGCPYPFVYRALTNSVDELQLSALPLGLRSQSSYEVREVQLAVNDLIVFCSDGVIEAANTKGDIFGFDRVADIICKAGIQRAGAESLLNSMFTAVEEFSGVTQQDDDQTIVVVHRTEES